MYGEARHLDVQVDAIEQRPRDAGEVTAHRRRRAAAAAGRIARIAAGAGIHGGDELEARRELAAPGGARDADRTGLERLAQRLEDVAAVLRQLVEKQDAAMRERYLARPQPPASADHGRRGGAMVRRAKRRPPPLGHGRQRTNQRMQHRALERRVVIEGRQESWQALRQHALARARRPDEQEAVPARGRDLERAPRGGLAAHIGKVGRRGAAVGQLAAAFEGERRAA